MRPALRFEGWQGAVWRMIEGQYRPATQKLVETLAQQARLEQILDASKPSIPPECAHLDYQLAAPFRYGPYPRESRFRRPGPTPGVYYAAETPLTAAVETAWGRVAFFRASPGTPLPATSSAHTVIRAQVATGRALDLTAPDMAALGDWMHPTDYAATCALADAARAQGCGAIRYASARDPGGGRNWAVLTCAAFAAPAPDAAQTWHLMLKPDRVIWTNETLRQGHEFGIGAQALTAA